MFNYGKKRYTLLLVSLNLKFIVFTKLLSPPSSTLLSTREESDIDTFAIETYYTEIIIWKAYKPQKKT